MKRKLKRPLIVDVDDYELSFFKNHQTIRIEELNSDSFVDEEEKAPYSETWSRFSETLLEFADGITVSNKCLQEKFGGIIVTARQKRKQFQPANLQPNAV